MNQDRTNSPSFGPYKAWNSSLDSGRDSFKIFCDQNWEECSDDVEKMFEFSNTLTKFGTCSLNSSEDESLW